MRYRTAVIGAGMMGRVHAHSYRKADLGADVAYIVDRDVDRARQLAEELGGEIRVTGEIADVLGDPNLDIVDICAPTRLHCGLAVPAAEAGKHVLCEKPIALTLVDADRMIAACRQAGVQFMVAHVLRFWPEYVALADLVRENRLGDIRHISCWRLSAPPDWSKDNWINDAAQSGFAVYDLAIHDYDVVRWLGGDITGTLAAAGNAGHFTALFALSGGATAQVEASFTMPAGFPFRMGVRVTGDRGFAEFDGSGGVLTLVADGKQQSLPVVGTRTFRQDDDTEELDGYAYEIGYFVDCLRDGRLAMRSLPDDARAALAVAVMVDQALSAPV